MRQFIFYFIVTLLALIAAGRGTVLAETVTYTISGHTVQGGDAYFDVSASGDATGTASTTWVYATATSASVPLPGDVTLGFGTDMQRMGMTVQDRLRISANTSDGCYVTLTHASKYIYHITLQDGSGNVFQEVWNRTKSYTYRASEIQLKTIIVEYATAIPITDAVISGVNDSYFVSNAAVKPTPTVTWHGTTLTKGNQYSLSYQNNTVAGTATVVATGTGIFSTRTSVSKNYTLVWATYTVHFDKNNDSASGTMSDQAFYYSEEKTLAANDFTAPAVHHFDRWTTKANGTGNSYTDGQSVSNLTATNGATVTLYAQWAADTFTITLDNQGATTAGTVEVTATYGAALPAITVPAKTGYTFGGYFTEAAGGGTKYYNSDGTSAHTWDITAATTLYAQWTVNTYAVALDNQGATTAGSTEVTATYGAALPAITAPAKTGYTFGGYYKEPNGGGTKYYNADGTSAHTWDIASATILYAQWTPIAEMNYIDANGDEQVCNNFTIIQRSSSGQTLGDEANDEAWYVVLGDVTVKGALTFKDKAVHLILCDGASLSVNNRIGYAIKCNYDLYFYVQSGGTGSIRAFDDGGHSEYADYSALQAGNISINGGTVTATSTRGGISASGDVIINGGTITATGYGGIGNLPPSKQYGISASGSVTINGGNVTATGSGQTHNGIIASSITLGWTNASDRITASGCNVNPVVKSGQYFTNDGTHIYTGTLTNEEREAIRCKTLRPYLNPDNAQEFTLTQGTKDGVTAWWGTFYNNSSNCFLIEGAAAYTLGSDYKLYRLGVDGRTIPRGAAVVIIATEATPVSPATSPATATIEFYDMGTGTLNVTDHAPGGNQLRGGNNPVPVSGLSGTPYVLSVNADGTIGFHPYIGTEIPANKAYYLQ